MWQERPCDEWPGTRNNRGYGVDSQGRLMHRVAWEVANGPVPGKLCVLHHCDNRPCREPTHLFLGTRADNIKDMDRKGRRIALAGEAHGRAKLTGATVMEARKLRADGWTLERLAARFGVTHRAVRLACIGETWKSVTT